MVQKHWSQRLREWIVSFSATGYAVSFFLHLAVLLLLSIVVVNNLTQSGSLIAVSFDENGAETEFEEILDTRLDATEEVAPETPEFTAVPLEPIENAEPAFPEVSDTPSPSLQGMLEDSKAKKSSPSPAIQIPQGGNAVTRGSFTAWTVPDDPEPGENYLIVVQIQVPGHLEKYPLRDLKGMVIGTDRYRQYIPGNSRGYLPVKDSVVQFVVAVPGAEALVEDTISIESRRILKEKQTLKIQF